MVTIVILQSEIACCHQTCLTIRLSCSFCIDEVFPFSAEECWTYVDKGFNVATRPIIFADLRIKYVVVGLVDLVEDMVAMIDQDR